MKKVWCILLFIILVSGNLLGVNITDLQVTEKEGKTELFVSISKPVKFTYFTLESPYRLIISFPEQNISSKISSHHLVEKGVISSIELNFTGQKQKRFIDYIVVRLKTDILYKVSQKPDGILISLEPLEYIPEESSLFGTKMPSKITSLPQCIQIGLENSNQIKIAKENIHLARLKVASAFRNLFPAIALKADATRGTIELGEQDETKFSEAEVGIQISQPLYQGGKIISTYKQALAQLQVAQNEYRKIRNEIIFEIKKAYYNLLKNKQNVKQDKNLIDNISSYVEKTKKARRLGAITKSEYLNVLSQYHKALYQKSSDEKDLSLTITTLRNLLNIETNIEFSPKETLSFNKKDVSLSEALTIGEKSRPELIMQKFIVKQALYLKEVALSERRFQIDLTGFYGRAGGAYETEKLLLSESWQAGLQIKKYFGGSSIVSSVSSEESSPKLGQSTRTGSEVASVTIGLLDSLQTKVNVKEAQIKYEKALEELNKIKRKTDLEIREAFFNYQKANLQFDTVKKEIEFRQEDVKIAKKKVELNIIPFSELIQKRIQLNDAYNSYNESLAFYNISIANLNKSIGRERY